MDSKFTPNFNVTQDGCGCGCGHIENKSNPVIAIASVPCQLWSEPYDMATGLKEGTVFPDLNKTFYKGGNDDVR